MSMTHDYIIAVIQAEKDGKAIEFRETYPVDNEWKPYSIARELARGFQLRIKPSPPKPREWWIRVCANSHIQVMFDSMSQAVTGQCSHCEICHVQEVLPNKEEA